MRAFGLGPSRPTIALALAGALLLASGSAPTWGQQQATFSGAIFDPVGKAQPEFQLVLIDVATGHEYVSGKTGPSGEYALSVPVGIQYRVAAVIAPDGTRLAVQDLPPIAVRVPGNNRLDVRFQMRPLAAESSPATPEERRHKKSGVPWWKTPGGVTGIVVGAAAIAALALSGGGSDGGTVSRSNP